MKGFFYLLTAACMITGCSNLVQKETAANSSPLQGTWKLLTGQLVEKGDTTVTDYSKDREFIKIINGTHFAFLGHDLHKGQDSAAFFTAGGGHYSLSDSNYTEHLEYCNDRAWEQNNFSFTITFHGDTLIQRGVEKIDSLGISRLNIETYVRQH
jgi:hypothetical protein